MIKSTLSPKNPLLLLTLLLLALLPARMASAQENDSQPAIQQMRIQIMPEYDDPRVLVIAQGRLDVPGGVYNGPVTFRIPAGAQINQMAVMDLDLGGPQFQPFDTKPDPTDPAWQLVTYTLTNPHFFYEYYYDLPGSGSQKQFTFSLNSLDDITVLSMEVQQPLKAESFSVEPATATSRSDTAGFTYWQLPDQSVTGGQQIDLLVRYTKSDPNPSVARQTDGAVQMSGEVGTAVPEAEQSSTSFIGLTIIGVALVIIFGFIRFRIRPSQEPVPAAVAPASQEPIRPAPLSAITEPTQAPRAKFCTQCGQGISPDARFCPYCGEVIKR